MSGSRGTTANTPLRRAQASRLIYRIGCGDHARMDWLVPRLLCLRQQSSDVFQ